MCTPEQIDALIEKIDAEFEKSGDQKRFLTSKLIDWKLRLLQYRSGEIMQPESGVKKRYCGEKSELDRL